jgi:hypothetical protein
MTALESRARRGERSRCRVLHESVESSSGANSNYDDCKAGNDERAHSLSLASRSQPITPERDARSVDIHKKPAKRVHARKGRHIQCAPGRQSDVRAKARDVSRRMHEPLWPAPQIWLSAIAPCPRRKVRRSPRAPNAPRTSRRQGGVWLRASARRDARRATWRDSATRRVGTRHPRAGQTH